jgi:hypothetical protein
MRIERKKKKILNYLLHMKLAKVGSSESKRTPVDFLSNNPFFEKKKKKKKINLALLLLFFCTSFVV